MRGVLADAGDEPVAVVAQRCGIDAHRIGSPRARQAAFVSSTVWVPSWKIDAASAASAPASSASARCSGLPAPPEATTGTFDASRTSVRTQLEVVAVLDAVGVHRRHQDLARAELDRVRAPRRWRPSRSRGARRRRRRASRRRARAARRSRTPRTASRSGRRPPRSGPGRASAAVLSETLSAPASSSSRTRPTRLTPPPTVSGTSICSAARSTARASTPGSSPVAVMLSQTISSAPCSA